MAFCEGPDSDLISLLHPWGWAYSPGGPEDVEVKPCHLYFPQHFLLSRLQVLVSQIPVGPLSPL